MRRRRRNGNVMTDDDADPLSVVVNLFDVAMVMHMNMTEVFSQEDFTVVKNPGTDKMQIITKKGREIKTYKASGEADGSTGARGRRLGTAYELEDGKIIYVPDE